MNVLGKRKNQLALALETKPEKVKIPTGLLTISKVYCGDNKNNAYDGTAFEDYMAMPAKSKGNLGELFVKTHCENIGLETRAVEKKEKNGPFDLWVSGKKVEVKMSLAKSWIINHIALGKDFERLVFVGVRPDETFEMKWIEKCHLVAFVKYGMFFNKQQGGKKAKNDDWMTSGKNLLNMMAFMRPMSEF